MSGHWDDHDVVRMARRVRDVELALDARRQELEWVVSERDSLRARVAELTLLGDGLADANRELAGRIAELEGALRDLCDEVEAAGLAAVRARRLVKEEVEP